MKKGHGSGRASATAVLPMHVFTIIFVIIPLAYTVFLSFMTQAERWGVEYRFTLQNYLNILKPVYLNTFVQSARLGVTTTAFCALIGYPAGLFIAQMKPSLQRFFIGTQMFPFWINSLIRLYGWIILFSAGGLVDRLLIGIGLTREPLKLLYSYPAVVVGMIYVLLPFMIFSVYSAAAKLDPSAGEAARDLGAGRAAVFRTITLPLTLRGLLTGVTLTFIPSMGLFFIASILGGNKIVLVGSLIDEQLNRTHNLPFAAALAVILMILTGAVVALTRLADPARYRRRRANHARMKRKGGAHR